MFYVFYSLGSFFDKPTFFGLTVLRIGLLLGLFKLLEFMSCRFCSGERLLIAEDLCSLLMLDEMKLSRLVVVVKSDL